MRVSVPIGKTLAVSTGKRLAVSSYKGPLDGITVVLGYALRLLDALYLGPLIRLRRDSDNAELDFYSDTAGVVDLAAIATWLGAATGYIATLYDQSGNENDSIETTASCQPKFIASQNGRPALDADGVLSRMSLTSSITASRTAYATVQDRDGFSGSIWVDRAGSAADYMYTVNQGGNIRGYINDAPSNWGFYDSGVPKLDQAILCGSWQSGGNKHGGVNGYWGAAVAASTDCIWDELFRYTDSRFYADGYCWEIVILPDDERDSATEDSYLADTAAYYGFSLDA